MTPTEVPEEERADFNEVRRVLNRHARDEDDVAWMHPLLNALDRIESTMDRITKERDEARAALRALADDEGYDETGVYIDEWTESSAFYRHQAIAKHLLEGPGEKED